MCTKDFFSLADHRSGVIRTTLIIMQWYAPLQYKRLMLFVFECLSALHLIHFTAMFFFMQKKVVDIREQLRRIAQRLGVTLKSCDKDLQVMLLLACFGFYYFLFIIVSLNFTCCLLRELFAIRWMLLEPQSLLPCFLGHKMNYSHYTTAQVNLDHILKKVFHTKKVIFSEVSPKVASW